MPGAVATPANLKKIRKDLSETLKREATDDDVYSHLMYPQVFADFVKHRREFSDVSVLPTLAFFYGLFDLLLHLHFPEGWLLSWFG